MALRVLSLLLLSFLFAQPWLKEQGATAHSDFHHIVALDTSLSMQAGSRWENARRIADKLIDDLGSTQSVELVAFDHALTVVADNEASRFDLTQGLNSLEPGHGHADYGFIMQRLNRLATSKNLPTKVWMISDAQKSAFPAQKNSLYAPGIKDFEFVNVVSDAERNVHLRAHAFTVDGASAKITVQLGQSVAGPATDGDSSNTTGSNSDVSATAVTVRVNYRDDVLVQERVNVNASDVRTVVFDDITLPATQQPVLSVSLAESDDLPSDNVADVVIRQSSPIDVAFLRHTSGAARAAEVFISTALETDDAAVVQVLNGTAERVEPSILHVATSRDLRQFDIDQDIQSILEEGKNALVFARTPEQSNRSNQIIGIDVGLVDESHPLALGDIDWVGVSFYDVSDMNTFDDDRVLVATADRQPILIERMSENGKLLILNDAIDGRGSNFPLTPAFVDLMQSIVRYFDSSAALPDTLSVGDSLLVNGNVQVLDPNDKPLLQLDQSLNTGGIRVEQPGIYKVVGVSGTHLIDVSTAPQEADLSLADLSDINGWQERFSTPQNTEESADVTQTSKKPPSQLMLDSSRSRHLVWLWLLPLLAAIIFMESALANRRLDVRRDGS